MQCRVESLDEKPQKDGGQPYTLRTTRRILGERARQIKPIDMAIDLLPLFGQRAFIENWIAAFQENSAALASVYL